MTSWTDQLHCGLFCSFASLPWSLTLSALPHPWPPHPPLPSTPQIADPAKLDAIFVAIGGGGLIAGIAAYVKALHPHIQVIGVEPCGANAMAMSLQQGRRVTLSRVDAFADGVAVKHVSVCLRRWCGGGGEGVVCGCGVC